jgi:hypothetical protein
MANKRRDLLEVLRLELEFLKAGGYYKSASWRPQFIFEDSPTCLNYGDPLHKRLCSQCVLLQLVPVQFRGDQIPCRHIPLNQECATIHSLYKNGTSDELEAAVSEWLMNMIQKLESEPIQGGCNSDSLIIPKTSAGKA